MNNTVIITGASAGIGKALAYKFARHNFNLLLVARSEDKLKKLCTEPSKSYGMNRLFIPYLKENGGGTIVNIASTLVFAPIYITKALLQPLFKIVTVELFSF